jgi:perosamine synthetase
VNAPLALFGRAPAVDNARHVRWPVLDARDRDAVMAVLDRGVLSGPLAPEVRGLEREFAAWLGTRYALATNSGTAALHIALAAAGVGAGDEVITSAYTFVATPLAALHQQAVPVFVDIEPRSCGLDPRLVEAAITTRTKAIVPVHIHGTPCELDAIHDLARRHGLAVIEDACQAHGATYKGRPVGTFGAAAAFSLQSSKNLACGEGGVFVTDDAALFARANRVRMFGEDVRAMDDGSWREDRCLDASRAYDSATVGWMYRTNEMSAALARSQLRGLDGWNERGRRNARRLSAALSKLPGVTPPEVFEDRVEVVHKYRVRLDGRAMGVEADARRVRDAVMAALRAEGLEVVLWQTQPVPGQRLFRERVGFGHGVPWNRTDAVDYDLARFPETTRLLDGSVVLFSQSCPILAQPDDLIDAYAEAFARVWAHLPDLVSA